MSKRIVGDPSLHGWTEENGKWVWDGQSGGADGALQNVVEDTTPQLGGNLDVNGNEIRAGSGNLVMYALDDFTLNWSGDVDPVIHASSMSGKIAIHTRTFSSSSITFPFPLILK